MSKKKRSHAHSLHISYRCAPTRPPLPTRHCSASATAQMPSCVRPDPPYCAPLCTAPFLRRTPCHSVPRVLPSPAPRTSCVRGVPQRRYTLSVPEGHTMNPVCVWGGGSCLTDDDEGDVSVSMLSGWCITSRLDAATPVPANVAEPSEPSECECKSTSYGRWDSDGLYTSSAGVLQASLC